MTPSLPTWLQRLRQSGEADDLEAKSLARAKWDIDGAALARALVALANTRGGELVLGVEDDCTVSGAGTAAQCDAVVRKVADVANQQVRPSLPVHIAKVQVEQVTVVVVRVPAFAADRPFSHLGRYYVRDASSSRQARRDELVRLLESAAVMYDESPIAAAGADDLDLALAADTLARAYGRSFDPPLVARYLHALHATDRDGQPTVAGVLCFGAEPQRWLPDAVVSVCRMVGSEWTTQTADRLVLGGPLPAQVEGAAAFLSRHLAQGSASSGWQRPLAPAPGRIPLDVLREAVVNAVAHRDYRAASQVRVFVFDDRVEVVSPGGLLNHLTLDSIRLGGISQRRNPAIAAVLARLAWRENLGLGVVEMCRAMRDVGLPEPEFSVEGGHFRVALHGATVS